MKEMFVEVPPSTYLIVQYRDELKQFYPTVTHLKVKDGFLQLGRKDTSKKDWEVFLIAPLHNIVYFEFGTMKKEEKRLDKEEK